MQNIYFALTTWACLASAAPTAPVERPKVVFEEAKLSDDIKSILVPAKVEPKVQSTVAAETEGHVVRLKKNLGSVVKAGETILLLENQDPSFTYARVPVRSPIQGVLSQLQVSEMSRVARGDRLFTVVNNSSVKITSELPESDVALVKIGTEGKFKFGEAFVSVRIVGVSPLIDSRTGTASAEFEVLPKQKNLPAIGAIGQVQIQILRGKVQLLPESAVFYKDGKPHLRTIGADNQTAVKPVELGEVRQDKIVVKSGITPGDKIVVRSSRPIKDGEAVELQ